MNATEKQVAKVKKDYLHKGIYLNTADKLNKLEASRLIDLSVRMKEAEKQKTLLRRHNLKSLPSQHLNTFS